MPKIKNIIIFVSIAVVLVLLYGFFFPQDPEVGTLVSSSSVVVPDTEVAGGDISISQDFLTLLLNVKNIKLDDSIFSEPAFEMLHDSSITLTPDGNEGRVNPFAPLGTDPVLPQAEVEDTGAGEEAPTLP